jgi:hypothetical protein
MLRRDVLRLAGLVPVAASVGWLAGCDPSVAPDDLPGDGAIDPLLVRTANGLVVLDAGTGQVLAGPRVGAAAWDGSATVLSSVHAGSTTRVEISTGSGEVTSRHEIAGSWVPRVVQPSGRRYALVEGTGQNGGTAETYRPQGRQSTVLAVVSSSGDERRYELPGCVEPEAFSADGGFLYVLDYLPPEAPDRYRVRMLDLRTGAVGSLLTRDKSVVPPGAEEEMRGEGRQAVYAPSAFMLFTLYSHQPGHEHTRDIVAARPGRADVHAFVHSLSLDQSFAYCIDLLEPFGHGPVEGHTIAAVPGTADSVVIDGTSGALAEIDGTNLTVRRVFGVGVSTQEGPASAAVGDLLYVGRGMSVTTFRRDGYARVAEWPTPGQVRGVSLARDGRWLWVGQPDHLLALDTTTGRSVRSVALPGVQELVGS